MPDLHDIEKKVEYLSGRLDEIKESGMSGFDARLNTLQDRMNRQELYIKELLQSSHGDRLNFVESLKNMELSIVRMISDNIKALELAHKQDQKEQSGLNTLFSAKIAQGVVVVAALLFVAKEMISKGLN